MPAKTDSFDLARLQLRAGEGRRLELDVPLEPIVLGTDTYPVVPSPATVTLDISRMVGNGWSLRLRFAARLEGPCMRCLDPAAPEFTVDAREIEQPGAGEELDSPYVEADLLDVRQWAHDAFALTLPVQVLCTEDCPGLCPDCGVRLVDHPGHEHERPRDPRWAALDELKLKLTDAS